ncbi:MAG: hypothetical protein ACXWT4_20500 [Methylobacter sp.]
MSKLNESENCTGGFYRGGFQTRSYKTRPYETHNANNATPNTTDIDPRNPKIHRRKSIRLKHYDYSQAGAYFVTICTHHRQCLFGEIENGGMVLNGL